MPHREIVYRRKPSRQAGFVLASLWHGWWRAWIAIQQAVLFRPPRADAERVAVYAIGSIGDLTHTLPALGAIRMRHPDAAITLITNAVEGDSWAKRLGIDAALDMAIVTYASPTALREAARGRQALYYLAPFPLRGLRALRDMLFFALAGIRRARGFSAVVPRGWVARARRPWRTEPAQFERLLRVCGLPDGTRPAMPIDDAQALPETYVVLAPTGKDQTQHWPEERFIDLAKRLEAQGLQPVWVGLPADGERVTAAGNPPGKLLFGAQPFPALRNLLRRATAVVCNDSGIAHLAGYVGAPVVVVSSARAAAYAWQPPALGQSVKLLRKDMNCEACGLQVCSDVACLTLISVDEVWDALQGLL